MSLWYANCYYTQGYGCTDVPSEPYDPRHPECSRWHAGIDLATGVGTSAGDPIRCPVAGTRVVAIGGSESYYGPYYVSLEMPDRKLVILAHVQATYVNVGQVLDAGTHVADVGNLGASSGPHLHFEQRPYFGAGYGTDEPPTWFDYAPAPAPTPTPEDEEVTLTTACRLVLAAGPGSPGYELDRFGGVHPLNGAPSVAASCPHFTDPLATDLVITSWSPVQGYVLDGKGGIHPIAQDGAAPPAVPSGVPSF